MARRKVFYDRKGRPLVRGRTRERITFPELEERRSEGRKKPAEIVVPVPKSEKVFKLTRIHIAMAFILIAVIIFLVWFFLFVYPSPIVNLSPKNGSVLNAQDVKISASLSRKVEMKNIGFKVDGKDISTTAIIKGRTASCTIKLTDGKHEVTFEIDTGGIIGKRSARWFFTVDTTPPKLSVTEKRIKQTGANEVEISFAGETEPEATLEVNGKNLDVKKNGHFSGKVKFSRSRSLEICAKDQAGNTSKSYVVTQKPTEAKGAHVSIYIASSDTKLGKIMDLVQRTELNALEIDLKDEAGLIGFEIDNEIAKKAGAAQDYINLDECVDMLRYKGIYTICRIVVFKDPLLAKSRPDLAVHDSYGGLWGKGNWMDPYSREVWDYDLAVAEAAARAGFQEIQFDYVRFPSDGNITRCVYPHKDQRAEGQVIMDFLNYARQRLAPYNVFISVDLFGLTASKQGEMGIGQRVSDIAKEVDYISPMVYPSHYNPGEYNIKSPENNPGDTVKKSLEDFKKKIKGTHAKLRPWLQDFSLRVTYTADMVRRQIDATENLGIHEWLLWDPDCTYTESALKTGKTK